MWLLFLTGDHESDKFLMKEEKFSVSVRVIGVRGQIFVSVSIFLAPIYETVSCTISTFCVRIRYFTRTAVDKKIVFACGGSKKCAFIGGKKIVSYLLLPFSKNKE